MKVLPFFGSLDDFVSFPCPLFFHWDSKKYLSQKNVVEKLNANVMHGKVRKGWSDSSEGVMGLTFVFRWKSPLPPGLCPWPAFGR